MRVDLFENADNRCADHPASISITNVHFQEMCMATDDNNKSTTVTTLARTEETHTSQPLATDEYTSKQLTTTDIDGTFQNLDLSTSNQFPMHYIWMIVGIAFALLVAIIVVMLIAIVYLSHKKNKIRCKAHKF